MAEPATEPVVAEPAAAQAAGSGGGELLADLPVEVVCRILGMLDLRSLVAAASCCRHLRAVCATEDDLWRVQAGLSWGWLVPGPPPSGSAGPWRLFCERLHRAAAARQPLAAPAGFVVVGGAPGDSTAPAGLAVVLSGTGTGGVGPVPHWNEHPPPKQHRNMPGVLRDLAGGLVAVGGLDPMRAQTALRTVERYAHASSALPLVLGSTPHGPGWHPLPELREARCCAGVGLAADGELWAVGGGESMYRQSVVYATTERLAAGADGVPGSDGSVWEPGPRMGFGRCGAGVACGYQAGALYAAGGYGGWAEGRPPAGAGIGAVAAGGAVGAARIPLYLRSAEWLGLAAGSGEARWSPLPDMAECALCSDHHRPSGRHHGLLPTSMHACSEHAAPRKQVPRRLFGRRRPRPPALRHRRRAGRRDGALHSRGARPTGAEVAAAGHAAAAQTRPALQRCSLRVR